MSNEVILLLDKKGQLIYSRSNPVCKKCLGSCTLESETIKQCQQPGIHRRGVFLSDLGKAFLCTSDTDKMASSKIFKKELRFYSEMLGGFSDIKEHIQESSIKFTRRLIHNLTSLHAHILQDLYFLVPQESLSGSSSATNQLKAVKDA